MNADTSIITVLGTPAAFGVLFYLFGKWYLFQQAKINAERAEQDKVREAATAAREERLMAFMETVGPILRELSDEQRAATAIMERVDTRTERIEQSVGACDDRIIKAQRVKERTA
jgi:hypothetical protein